MSAELHTIARNEGNLRVYALGCVEFEAIAKLRRRLHYELSEDRSRASLILCEHPHTITVGRQGSRSHIRFESEEMKVRGWPIRWVNRGGGCILHAPGQIALYPILPLDQLRLNITEYLQKLSGVIRDLVSDFSIHRDVRASETGVCVGARLLAAIGVSVRDWISGYGAYINIQPALDAFRLVVSPGQEPMTSLARERRGIVRPSLVRERLIDHFQKHFGYSQSVFFSDHPMLTGVEAQGELTCKPCL